MKLSPTEEYQRATLLVTALAYFHVNTTNHYKSPKFWRFVVPHWLIIPPKVRLKEADFLYEMTNRLTTPPTHHGNAERKNYPKKLWSAVVPPYPSNRSISVPGFFWKVAGGRKLEEFHRNIMEYVFLWFWFLSGTVSQEKENNKIPP